METFRVNDNHSIAYCLVGYLCAYYRYYYPGEFITTYLNCAANEDDIADGTALANTYGIQIAPPRFGESKDVYVYNPETKTISKGIKSVKFMNSIIANELYDLRNNNYDTFMDLLIDINNLTTTNSRQLDLLIKIDYFNKFGNCVELLRIVEAFDFFKQGTAKKVAKTKLSASIEDIIRDYATDKNAKGEPLKSYTITDMRGLLNACEHSIKALGLNDLPIRTKMANQREILNYIDLTTHNPEDRRRLYVQDIYPMRSKQNNMVWGYSVITRSIGTGKTARLTVRSYTYDIDPIKKDDIIYAKSLKKNDAGYWYLVDYIKEI